MYLLLWKTDMLYLICMGSAELWRTGRERNIQNENICLQGDSNQQPSVPTANKAH